MRVLLLGLAVFLVALPVMAQGDAAPDVGLDTLLLYAAAVAGFVEIVKPLLAQLRARVAWSDDVNTFLIRAVAFATAVTVLVLTDTGASVVRALGLRLPAGGPIDTVLTALVLSIGSAGVWAAIRLFRPSTPQA